MCHHVCALGCASSEILRSRLCARPELSWCIAVCLCMAGSPAMNLLTRGPSLSHLRCSRVALPQQYSTCTRQQVLVLAAMQKLTLTQQTESTWDAPHHKEWKTDACKQNKWQCSIKTQEAVRVNMSCGCGCIPQERRATMRTRSQIAKAGRYIHRCCPVPAAGKCWPAAMLADPYTCKFWSSLHCSTTSQVQKCREARTRWQNARCRCCWCLQVAPNEMPVQLL
jgi:hypothetical protein